MAYRCACSQFCAQTRTIATLASTAWLHPMHEAMRPVIYHYWVLGTRERIERQMSPRYTDVSVGVHKALCTWPGLSSRDWPKIRPDPHALQGCLSSDNGGAKSGILKKVERREGKHVRRVTFPAIGSAAKRPSHTSAQRSLLFHLPHSFTTTAHATRYPPDPHHHVHGPGRPHAHSALG